jgi:hypothetical protein
MSNVKSIHPSTKANVSAGLRPDSSSPSGLLPCTFLPHIQPAASTRRLPAAPKPTHKAPRPSSHHHRSSGISFYQVSKVPSILSPTASLWSAFGCHPTLRHESALHSTPLPISASGGPSQQQRTRTRPALDARALYCQPVQTIRATVTTRRRMRVLLDASVVTTTVARNSHTTPRPPPPPSPTSSLHAFRPHLLLLDHSCPLANYAIVSSAPHIINRRHMSP